MRVILKETIDSLGLRGDIVEVKPGYGRNYLIPKGLAVPATESNIRRLEHERAVIDAALVRERRMAEELAERIESVVCTIPAKVGEGEKLYGSVTNMDIAKALREQGFDVDRKKIVLDDPIKTLGEHTVKVRLFPEVSAQLRVNVVKE